MPPGLGRRHSLGCHLRQSQKWPTRLRYCWHWNHWANRPWPRFVLRRFLQCYLRQILARDLFLGHLVVGPGVGRFVFLRRPTLRQPYSANSAVSPSTASVRTSTGLSAAASAAAASSSSLAASSACFFFFLPPIGNQSGRASVTAPNPEGDLGFSAAGAGRGWNREELEPGGPESQESLLPQAQSLLGAWNRGSWQESA